jgi:hypothetical protein
VDGRAPDGTPIDVIEGREPWWPQALNEASTSFDQQGLPVLTLPYLVLMKLAAGRPIDSNDVSRMMARASSQDRAAAEELVGRYDPESLDDLASLLALGRLEMETPNLSHDQQS